MSSSSTSIPFKNDHTLSSTAATKTFTSTAAKRIEWDDLDPLKYYSLNFIIGGTIDLVMYPLDVIRTRLQVQGSSNVHQSFPHYGGTYDGFKKLHSHEGFKGFYKGFLTSEFGYLCSRGVYFGTYEIFKQSLFRISNISNENPDSFENSQKLLYITTISGAMAESLASFIWVPFDVATQSVQIQGSLNHPKYRGGRDVFQKIYGERGIKGLYRGFGATMMRNVPYSGIWWGSYELSKSKLHDCNIRGFLGIKDRSRNMTLSVAGSTDQHNVEDEDPLVHMISGFAAALIATTLTNPLDVAKTRLQTGVFPAGQKPNFISVIKDTIRKEGVRALWKGLVPSLLTSTPYSMISIILYEEVKKLSLKN
eukprot:gene4670-5835_t